MSFKFEQQKFGKKNFVPEGWYWLLQSSEIKSGQAKPASFLAQQFVVYRGEDKKIRVFEAYCPHMGAHLCDGSVEGNSIRCPFHFWKFDPNGLCIEIPAENSSCQRVPALNSFPAEEKYGLIWIWLGASPPQQIPTPLELQNDPLDFTLGTPFRKNCHPNVMMINAIDAQHFRSVHNLIVDLDMQPKIISPYCIQFSNQTPLPPKNFLLKWISQFYKKSLTYELTYWWGHNGSVKVGPDFLHFYIIFALRPTLDGKSEGQTILLTQHREGIFRYIISPILLFLTKLVGDYFAKGDTLIFSRINFNYKTPIRADKAILNFISHYEKQESYSTKKGLLDGTDFGTQPSAI